jgi:hypothetical protein
LFFLSAVFDLAALSLPRPVDFFGTFGVAAVTTANQVGRVVSTPKPERDDVLTAPKHWFASLALPTTEATAEHALVFLEFVQVAA